MHSSPTTADTTAHADPSALPFPFREHLKSPHPFPLREHLEHTAAMLYGAGGIPEDMRELLDELRGAERVFLRLAWLAGELMESDTPPGFWNGGAAGRAA